MSNIIQFRPRRPTTLRVKVEYLPSLLACLPAGSKDKDAIIDVIASIKDFQDEFCDFPAELWDRVSPTLEQYLIQFNLKIEMR